MKRAVALLALAGLAGCSSASLKPRSLKAEAPLIERGWSYAESSRDFVGMESGLAPQSYGGPLLISEKLIFASERFGLTALSKRGGQLLWQKKFADGVSALPFQHDDNLFVGTDSGDLHRLSLDTGSESWAVNLGAPVHGSMAFAEGRLFVATADEALHAVDPSTGKVIWTYRRPSFGGTSIKGGGHPAMVGGLIWMGFSDGALVSINPQTGSMESEKIFRDNLKFMDIDAKVIGWKGGLLVSTYDGKLRYLRKDGSLIWEFAAGGARAPLVTEGNVIYLPSSDGTVYALHADSGKEIWRYAFRRGVPTGVSLVNRGTERLLVATGSEEKLIVLDAGTGKVKAESSFGRGSGSFAPIAVDQDSSSFFVLSSYSRIYQFRVN
jgi:outer membrane protein assembly factor BamB